VSEQAGGAGGRSVLVTGAGRGIGRALALALAADGARVCLAARSRDELEDVAGRVRGAGGDAVTCQGDVTDPSDAERMVTTAVEAFGTLDVLVNNAGITRGGSILTQPVEDFDAVITTNLRGTFLCTQAAARRMVAAGRGKILTISSVFGTSAVREQSAYCASKAALNQFTRVVALELAPHGIQVNAIAPGYVATSLNEEALDDPATAERVLRRIPAGRIARPDDLAGIVRLLCSEASDYITGEVVVIDGGFGLR
jgi:2-deoxy-D-gluconate 3-dehydrogenase